MYSPADDAALPTPGFPIRRSAGQRLFSASPRLIAAVHVLLRLLTPRHPPRALNILTRYSIEHTYCRYAVFKVRAPEGATRAAPAHGAAGAPSKLNSMTARGADPLATNPLKIEVRAGVPMRCQVVDVVLGHRSPGREGTRELDGVPRDSGAQVALSATP